MWNKAIAAFITGVLGLLGQFGIDPEWATPELIAAVTAVLSTAAVYFLPNRT